MATVPFVARRATWRACPNRGNLPARPGRVPHALELRADRCENPARHPLPDIPRMYPPERIVCLTEETTETLYLLGEQHRIVGISGYTVRPPQARREKPRVSAFISVGRDLLLVRRQEVRRDGRGDRAPRRRRG